MDKTQLHLLAAWDPFPGIPCVLRTQVLWEDQLPVLTGQSALNAA